MKNQTHYRKLETMYLSAPINRFFEPSIRIGEGQGEITVNAREELYHAADAVHGSVYFKSLDDSAFLAVNSLVQDVFVLTVSFNLYLTRPVAEGEMRVQGSGGAPVGRLFVTESVLYNSQGKALARGSGTFMKSTVPLTPEIGYSLK